MKKININNAKWECGWYDGIYQFTFESDSTGQSDDYTFVEFGRQVYDVDGNEYGKRYLFGLFKIEHPEIIGTFKDFCVAYDEGKKNAPIYP